MAEKLVARAYIDGFNLWYGALRKTPERWLDISAWCQSLLPQCDMQRVFYCTARVSSRPDDPDSHVRQDAYIRALRTLDGVEVLEGTFKVAPTRMWRVPSSTCRCCASIPPGCQCCRANTAEVIKTEEKGSDVNLAVHLVADAHRNFFDTALVVSNDSDIQPAVDLVRETGKKVIVADPRNSRYPSLLGDERRRLRRPALVACQLPVAVTDRDGRVITRPTSWA